MGVYDSLRRYEIKKRLDGRRWRVADGKGRHSRSEPLVRGVKGTKNVRRSMSEDQTNGLLERGGLSLSDVGAGMNVGKVLKHVDKPVLGICGFQLSAPGCIELVLSSLPSPDEAGG